MIERRTSGTGSTHSFPMCNVPFGRAASLRRCSVPPSPPTRSAFARCGCAPSPPVPPLPPFAARCGVFSALFPRGVFRGIAPTGARGLLRPRRAFAFCFWALRVLLPRLFGASRRRRGFYRGLVRSIPARPARGAPLRFAGEFRPVRGATRGASPLDPDTRRVAEGRLYSAPRGA